MSESPNVLIAVGNTTEGAIPQQNYKNIFTEFNIASFNTESDADFYNIQYKPRQPKGFLTFIYMDLCRVIINIPMILVYNKS